MSLQADVTDRRALVTGAASGIGRAIAQTLVARGAEVLMVDLPGAALEDAARASGAAPVGADLTDRAALADVLSAAGTLDILVNSAGVQHVAPVHEFPPDAWDSVMAVILTAPFLLARGVLPSMLERGWGRIVSLASVHGVTASPGKAAYVAAKHGLIGLTKTIALEAAAKCSDVTAHAICPSYVRTPLVEAQIDAQASLHGIAAEDVVTDVLLRRNAVKRLIEPKAVADVVVSMCGPNAWTMTGAVVQMDAGWLAH